MHVCVCVWLHYINYPRTYIDRSGEISSTRRFDWSFSYICTYVCACVCLYARISVCDQSRYSTRDDYNTYGKYEKGGTRNDIRSTRHTCPNTLNSNTRRTAVLCRLKVGAGRTMVSDLRRGSRSTTSVAVIEQPAPRA